MCFLSGTRVAKKSVSQSIAALQISSSTGGRPVRASKVQAQAKMDKAHASQVDVDKILDAESRSESSDSDDGSDDDKDSDSDEENVRA